MTLPDGELKPRSMRQSGPRELEIVWNDGHESRYPVAYLRRSCRCALCVDEWSGKQLLEPTSISDEVKPLRLETVGRYAIRVEWSDGHQSGIYSFEHLRDICPCHLCRPDGK